MTHTSFGSVIFLSKMKEAGIPITNGVGASKICSELGIRQGRSGMTSENKNKNSLTILVLRFKFDIEIQSLCKKV